MGLIKRLLEINYKLKNKDAKFYKKLGVNIAGDDVNILNSDLDENYPYLLSIGNHVTITHSTVLTHDATTIDFSGYTKVGKVSIGSHVFVGYNSLVLPGSTIGSRVIIGANSMVKGDVPSNGVYAGNPLRYICSYDEYVEKHMHKMENNSFAASFVKEERDKLLEALDKNKISYSK